MDHVIVYYQEGKLKIKFLNKNDTFSKTLTNNPPEGT